MFVTWSAATKERQHFSSRVGDGMDLPWWNGNGISTTYWMCFFSDGHVRSARKDVIDFFCSGVVVWSGGNSGWNACLGQALVSDHGIAMRKKLPNDGTIFGGEGGYFLNVVDIHEILFKEKVNCDIPGNTVQRLTGTLLEILLDGEDAQYGGRGGPNVPLI